LPPTRWQSALFVERSTDGFVDVPLLDDPGVGAPGVFEGPVLGVPGEVDGAPVPLPDVLPPVLPVPEVPLPDVPLPDVPPPLA
jgi:hypothetical protein